MRANGRKAGGGSWHNGNYEDNNGDYEDNNGDYEDNAVADTPNWENGKGYGCTYYGSWWCYNGAARTGKEWSLGSKFNYPENNCIVCGKSDSPNVEVDDGNVEVCSGRKCNMYRGL